MPSSTNPSSFIQWKKPVADVHPRLWITNRRRVAIGAIAGGSFTHGSTITWSGGSGKVVSNTANGASTLYYEPVSGTQVANGQTITQGGVTTTASAAAVADGLTTAAAITRSTGSAATAWAEVVAYANRVDTTTEKSNTSWGQNQDYTRLACLALSYLITGNTVHGDRAAAVLDYLANTASWTGLAESHQRERLLAMGFAYDWAWPRLSAGQKDTVGEKIRTEVGNVFNPGTERLWGTQHGKMCYALAAQIAVMEDTVFTSGEADTMNTRMDTMMDALDNGTSGSNGDSFFSAFRFFGDDDGGTHKGSGSFSYFTVNEQFYTFLMPAVRSGLVVDLYGQNPWWKKTMEWVIWHLRSDYKGHTQGDHRHLSDVFIDASTAAHALQIIDRETDTLGQICQWYIKDLVPFVGNTPFNSHYNIYPFIFGKTTSELAKVAPTLANLASGKRFRDFDDIGKTVFRTGFPTPTSKQVVSLAFHWPKYFVGDHQHRDMGHFSLEAFGEILCPSHGHYDPGQSRTFQSADGVGGYIASDSSTWTTHSGHRYSFNMQSLSKNTIRIFNETDDDTADLRKDNYQEFQSANSTFGKSTGTTSTFAGTGWSNYGGFQWPKDVTLTDGAPATLEGLLAENKWKNKGILSHASDNSSATYRVVDGKNWFWSTKCSRWKRHVFMLHEDQIAGYPYPIYIIWDDIISLLGTGTKGGNKTQIFQLQTTCPPTGMSADETQCVFQRTPTSPKLFVRWVRPSAITHDVYGGSSFQAFRDADGIQYPPHVTYPLDDSLLGAYRNEWYGVNASTTRNFIVALMPTPATVSIVPTCTVIDEVGYFGITFTLGTTVVETRMAKGDSHSFLVGAVVEPPPPPPSGDVASRNRLFSGELWCEGAIPFPDNTLTASDRAHLCDTYSGIAAQPPPPPPPPPPIDISIGAPITPDVTGPAGGAIVADTGPLGGAPITSDVGPITGAPIAV